MNANAIGTGARAVALALVLVAAAVAGLIVGNLMQDGPGNRFGYPTGYQGGAAAPRSVTAEAVFSLDAIEALQSIRGDAQVATDDTGPATITSPTPR